MYDTLLLKSARETIYNKTRKCLALTSNYHHPTLPFNKNNAGRDAGNGIRTRVTSLGS